MFECHVRFERIFASKILTWAVAVTFAARFHEKLVFEHTPLLNKMQYSSDITSKVRIKRFSWDIKRGTSIKSKDGPFGDKELGKKSHSAKKLKRGTI